MEFLTEHPVDEMYADNLLVNYSGFYSMISAQRGLMRNEHCKYSNTSITPNSVFNGGSDLYFGNQRISTARWFNWPNMIVQDTDGEVFSETFSNMYTIINVSNMIINRAENDEDVDWEAGTAEAREARRLSIIAQARFFRAWAYRHLTYAYGDVPLSLEEITGSNYRTNWDRDPVEKVREAMIEDFKFCVEHLDWRTDGNNTKPNRAIASHYLAETYMAMGRYADAVAVLKELCENSPYHRHFPQSALYRRELRSALFFPQRGSRDLSLRFYFTKPYPEYVQELLFAAFRCFRPDASRL